MTIANHIGGFSAHLPVRVISEANAHAHWRVRQRRAKAQRAAVQACIGRTLGRAGQAKGKPKVVKLVRLAPRRLDDDNLASAFKAARDQVAEILGFDDRDESVKWEYDQRKPIDGEPEGFWIKVEW